MHIICKLQIMISRTKEIQGGKKRRGKGERRLGDEGGEDARYYRSS